jgi:hypothetical protein
MRIAFGVGERPLINYVSLTDDEVQTKVHQSRAFVAFEKNTIKTTYLSRRAYRAHLSRAK